MVLDAKGWADHDVCLSVLQGTSLRLQHAVFAELPLLGVGFGLVMPMLTLTALEEGDGLWILTEVAKEFVKSGASSNQHDRTCFSSS